MKPKGNHMISTVYADCMQWKLLAAKTFGYDTCICTDYTVPEFHPKIFAKMDL